MSILKGFTHPAPLGARTFALAAPARGHVRTMSAACANPPPQQIQQRIAAVQAVLYKAQRCIAGSFVRESKACKLRTHATLHCSPGQMYLLRHNISIYVS